MLGHRPAALVPRLFFVLLALSLTSCDDGGGVIEGFELSGRCEELLGPDLVGDGISGANVTFRSDTLVIEQTTSDDGGWYRMRIMTDQPFGQVRAEAEGYQTTERTVFFDAPTRRVDLEMRPTNMADP